MPRKLRVEFEGAIYHVMNRGDRQEASRVIREMLTVRRVRAAELGNPLTATEPSMTRRFTFALPQ